jgi:Pentapeptide repeats (8 copies)
MALCAIDLTTFPVLTAIAALAVLAIAAVWLIPQQQARRWARQGIRGKQLADLENSARGTLVQIVGGIALLLTFAATWMQIADARKATNRTLRLNAAQQETDRFTRAVSQLGSAQFALRLGGIYALERLARDSPDERGPVISLLTAYLHEKHPAHPPVAGRLLAASSYKRSAFFTCGGTPPKPAADTQAALIAILRTAGRSPGRNSPLDLSGLDLRAVNIDARSLHGANLTGSSLAFAQAVRTNFDDADLERADMRHACLAEATLKRTFAFGGTRWWTWAAVNLDGADLYWTRTRSDINTAEETSTGWDSVSEAQLRGADGDECTLYPWRPKVSHDCGHP